MQSRGVVARWSNKTIWRKSRHLPAIGFGRKARCRYQTFDPQLPTETIANALAGADAAPVLESERFFALSW